MSGISLQANAAKLFGGNTVFALSQWLLVIAIARYAGPESLGVFALANSIVSPVFSFSFLGIRSAIATDYLRVHDSAQYFKIYLTSSVLALMACVLFSATLENTLAWCFFFLCIARVSENGSQFVYGFLQRDVLVSNVGISIASRGLLGIGGAGLVLYLFPGRIELVAAALASVWLLVFLCVDFRSYLLGPRGESSTALKISHSYGVESYRILFSKLLPLGLLALTTSLTLNVPRYFLDEYFDLLSLGYFAALAQLATAGVIMVNSIGQAVMPSLAKYYIDDHSVFKQLLAKSLVAVSIIGVLGLLVALYFGEPLLAVVYDPLYSAHADAFIVSMIWVAVLYVSVMFGCGLTAMRSFSSQFSISLASFVLTLLASFFMIPEHGILGGFCGLLVGSLGRVALQIVCMGMLLRVAAENSDP